MTNRALYVTTTRYDGIRRTLWDAQNLRMTANEQGFFDCTWTLPRRTDGIYDDFGDNFRVKVKSPRGDTAWEGRFEAPTRKRAKRNIKANSGIPCLALGDWASLTDRRESGTVIPSQDSPENLILWYADPTNDVVDSVSGPGWMAQLAGTNLANTGLSSANAYKQHNNSPADVTIANSILSICNRYGSVGGQKVVPQVWENRVLITKLLPTVPTARYLIKAAHIQEFQLERRLSLIATRVRIWYPTDGVGGKAVTYIENTTLQSTLAQDYGSGAVPFVREVTLDLTQTQNTAGITKAAAKAQAQTLLSTVTLPQATGTLTVDHSYGVFDVQRNQAVPLWAIRTGEWCEILDILPRPTDGGTGTSGGDMTLQTLYYITQWEYDLTRVQMPDGSYQEKELLRITPEKSNKLADLIGN
jgi:hypothetical protein